MMVEVVWSGVKAPTRDELTQLTYTIAQRMARFMERQGLMERDGEHSYLASVQRQGRKVFTL